MTQKQKYTVVYDRPQCIGAFACVAVHPTRWETGEDSKANLLSAIKKNEQYILALELTDEELAQELEAARVCPVNVIHIYDQKGNKLI
mgnify:CR=1 FL=1